MGRHTGNPCFFCGQKLTDDDDVVVCPECGTPYHRECWKESGHCTNVQLHATGGSWAPEKPAEEEKTQEQTCPNCGTSNAPEAQRCQNCGASLKETLQTPSWEKGSDDVPPQKESFRTRMEHVAEEMGMNDRYCGMDKEETLGGEPLGDVADFVENNTVYYLPRFKRFQETGKKISINFPGILFPHFYFANRKMWPLAFILAAVFALLSMPQMAMTLQTMLPEMITTLQEADGKNMAIAMFPDVQQTIQRIQGMQDRLETHENLIYNLTAICNYVEMCMKLFLGFFANWIYFRFVTRRVHQIREEHLPESMHRDRLRMRGGTSILLFIATIGVQYAVMLILTGVLYALLLL